VKYIPEPEWRFDEESVRRACLAPLSNQRRKMRSNLNRLQTQRRRVMHNAKVRDATTYS